jgi:hypothetical protein
VEEAPHWRVLCLRTDNGSATYRITVILYLSNTA